MQAMRAIGAMVLVLGLAPSLASMIVPEERLQLTGDIGGTHDPAVIKDGNTYCVFVTGGRAGEGILPIKTSADLRSWKNAGYARRREGLSVLPRLLRCGPGPRIGPADLHDCVGAGLAHRRPAPVILSARRAAGR
jgi:hypothetical protein